MENSYGCSHPGMIMLDEQALLVRLHDRKIPANSDVFFHYLRDRKISAIKALREIGHDYLGVYPSLVASKGAVEMLFDRWDGEPNLASPAARERNEVKAYRQIVERVRAAANYKGLFLTDNEIEAIIAAVQN